MVSMEIDLGPLLPHHLSELIMGVLLALVLWIVIAKFVMPKYETMYEERRAAIEGGMEKAEAAQKEAQAALEKYQAQLEDARGEAAQIKESAKAEGAQIIADMRERAQSEADRIVGNARTQLEAERSQIVQQLRGEIGGLATTLAGRIVGESMDDDERARRTVDRFIADLESSDHDAEGVRAQ